jgi:putative YhbY family RNA-binding protein
MITLNPAQRRELKARAHHLHPVVMIGDAGLTPTVVREIDTGLKSHELIKIRVFGDDRASRQALIDDICTRLDAAAVQHIGKILVIYRPRPEGSPAPARTDRRAGGAVTDKTAGRPRRGKQARRTKRSFQGA